MTFTITDLVTNSILLLINHLYFTDMFTGSSLWHGVSYPISNVQFYYTTYALFSFSGMH